MAPKHSAEVLPSVPKCNGYDVPYSESALDKPHCGMMYSAGGCEFNEPMAD